MMLLDTESGFSRGKNCTQLKKESAPRQYKEWAASKQKGCFGMNDKTFLSHLLFPILSRSSYLVLTPGSSSIWPFCSLASAPYPAPHLHGWLQSSSPLSLWMSRHFLLWDVLWDPICKPPPFQKGICPKHTDWAFLLLPVGSASQLLISLELPFLWNNYGTLATKVLYLFT